MGCRACGVVAHAHGRVEVDLVDAGPVTPGEVRPPAAVVRSVSSRTWTAYSRDTGPVTNRQPTTRRGWWRLLLAALAAALTVLLGAGTASAVTVPVLETRVGASTPTRARVVGVHESVSAGQQWGNAPPAAVSVVATGVAAKRGWASALRTRL